MKTKAIAAFSFALFLASVPGGALAASLETLVMPGPVAEAHAEIEEECGACHIRLGSGDVDALCLECHEAVAEDRLHKRGFHGFSASVSDQRCANCHTEHEGRDSDITGLQADLFDHSMTGFDLEGAHAPLACDGCHEKTYRETPSTCIGCHQQDDAHDGGFGEQCGDCHTPSRWLGAQFDHDDTGFPLVGKHADSVCAACHENSAVPESMDGEVRQCASCHGLDDRHDGRLGEMCDDCHSPRGWEAVSFDHQAAADFPLRGAHERLACQQCHVSEVTGHDLPTSCVGCHSANDVHLGRNGTECADCHSESKWQEASFDHERDTGFALVERHAEIPCEACHRESTDKAPPDTCEGCHNSDSPHGDMAGQCTDCHGQTSWLEAVRFHHDLTGFPLLGSHGWTACEQCHDGLAFSTEISTACNDCHEDEDVHKGAFGGSCDSCHNPVAWPLWTFDHDVATDFPLTGAHQELTCESCHELGSRSTPSASCGTCHRFDDAHDGAFGLQCGRCHTTDTFSAPSELMR